VAFQVLVFVTRLMLVSFFPRGGIDAQQPVSGTESARSAYDRNEAEKTPPTQTVNAEEEHDTAEEKAHPGVIRTYVVFHRRIGFGESVRPAGIFRCAWLGENRSLLAADADGKCVAWFSPPGRSRVWVTNL
jgi:hypothetical protein